MKHVFWITTLIILTNCTPADVLNADTTLQDEPETVVESGLFDDYDCFKTETDFLADSRIKQRTLLNMETFENHKTGIYFFTISYDPRDALTEMGATVEYTYHERANADMPDNTDELNPTTYPISSDFAVFHGYNQSGVFGDEDTVLNMAGSSSYIIVPHPDLVDEFEHHLTCDPR